jgi:hypothetical protein
MEITFQKVNDILRTLPVGYYLGTKANVQLDPVASTSFCNPIDGEIHVAFRNIQEILKNSPLDSVDNDELEQFIRTILYHEVSHLILTGDYSKIFWNGIPNWFNIFEDERIETLLASYYRNINFKKVIVRLNGWTPETPDNDATQYFYSICRFRRGPEKFVNRVSELIQKYNKLNAASGIYDDPGKHFYYNDVLSFWEEVKTEFNQEKGNNSSNQDSQKNQEASENSGNPQSKSEDRSEKSQTINTGSFGKSDEDNEEKESKEDEAEKAIEEIANKDDMSEKFNPEVVSQIIQKTFVGILEDQKVANDILARLEKIMAKVSKKKASSSPYSEGYAGKINPRSVAMRNDYRWLVHKNPEGCLRMGAKLHLNLWVDRSGSFYRSESRINQLLFAVNQFAKNHPKDFSFSVVTMGYTNKIHPKNLPIEISGGNKFGPGVPELWKKLSKEHTGKQVYNVVVWDGDLRSDICYPKNASEYVQNYRDAWRILDNPQTVIVSDSFNAKIINKGAKSAKKVFISEDYAEKFIDEVFKLLSQVIVA